MEMFSRLLVKLGLKTHHGLLMVAQAVLKPEKSLSCTEEGRRGTNFFLFHVFLEKSISLNLFYWNSNVLFLIGIHAVDC